MVLNKLHTRHNMHVILYLRTILNIPYKILKVGQDGISHKDSYLLHHLDPRVSRLPRLLAAADRLEEGEQGRNTKRHGNYSKCSAKRKQNTL